MSDTLRDSTVRVAQEATDAIRQEADAYRGDRDLPLESFVGIMATYAAFLGAGAIAVRRKGLPERLSWSDVALASVATHRLSRLISKDSVTSPIRAPFTRFKGTGAPVGAQGGGPGDGGPQGGRRAGDVPVLRQPVAGHRVHLRPRPRPPSDPAGRNGPHVGDRRRLPPVRPGRGRAAHLTPAKPLFGRQPTTLTDHGRRVPPSPRGVPGGDLGAGGRGRPGHPGPPRRAPRALRALGVGDDPPPAHRRLRRSRRSVPRASPTRAARGR